MELLITEEEGYLRVCDVDLQTFRWYPAFAGDIEHDRFKLGLQEICLASSGGVNNYNFLKVSGIFKY